MSEQQHKSFFTARVSQYEGLPFNDDGKAAVSIVRRAPEGPDIATYH